ncbi:hypothetical protein BGW36DRAFT_459948 [Talaromyces proteolyticus]|uniref:AN1-type domain-containing protein n=1 Tax=Talaromyces proteolyticus TaxID=1131652 RepID=A0AAD4KZS2_9EURO|nr:uncharacterized protein BGW36DRAFT_459948 [Talaromyces proteolyticus]KAH8700845.1 hypothetical protein BGW36DRAFT_459948 [Talaromyces proteolyticus]
MVEGDDRYGTCSSVDCTQLAAIDIGGCERCRKYYCFRHVDSPEHTCDKSPLTSASREETQNELAKQAQARLYEKGFVARLAKSTNDDTVHFGGTVRISKHYIDFRIASSKDAPATPSDDSKNRRAEHLLMRVYRDDFTPLAPESEMAAVLMLADVAALDHLRHTAWVEAAPHYEQFIFDPYCILFVDAIAAGKGKPLSTLNPSGREWQKIYSELAYFICDLDKPRKRLVEKGIPEEICSLFRYLGEIQTMAIYLEWTLASIGPFNNATEYYTTWAETLLQMITNRQIFNRFPVDAFLAFRYLKELAEKGRFNPFYPNEPELDTSHFYLKHSTSITEDKIIVDAQYKIVEIQDWTFSRLVPGYEAFGPSAIQLRPQPSRNNGDDEGINANEYIAATLEARRRPDLARYFRILEDNICSLAMGLGAGKYLEHEAFLATFKKILKLAGEIGDGHEEKFSWEKWRKDHLDLWADDRRLILLDFFI